MTTIRYVNIPDTDEGVSLATGLLWSALVERHPVTAGFWEQRRELRTVNKRDGSVRQEWCPVKGQYIRAVRTLELFDVDETDSGVYFTGMDRCPRDPGDWSRFGAPGIRRVCSRRVTSVTVHAKARYALVNHHFVMRVREHIAAHAPDSAWGVLATFTDSELWEVIAVASSSQHAIDLAAAHVGGRSAG